jgi:DNA-binding MarR family transcriptional regulator
MGTHTMRGGATAREVLDALRRIVQVLRESSGRAEQRLGITGAQLFVLEKLADAPSESLNDLAERTRTHQSSASAVVARLVDRGLVARHRAGSDGRRLELALTAKGRRLVGRVPSVQQRLVDTIEQLPPRSRRQLASLLRHVVVGLDALEREPAHVLRRGAPERKRSSQSACLTSIAGLPTRSATSPRRHGW